MFKKIIWVAGLFLIVICLVGLTGCVKNSGPKLAKMTCVINSASELICGSDWTMTNEGKEYKLLANQPVTVKENILIGVGDGTEYNAFFLFTAPGTYELNETTSQKAVGSWMAR